MYKDPHNPNNQKNVIAYRKLPYPSLYETRSAGMFVVTRNCLDFLLVSPQAPPGAAYQLQASPRRRKDGKIAANRAPRLDSQYKNSLSFASCTTQAKPSCRCSPVIALHRRMVHLCVLIASSCSPWRDQFPSCRQYGKSISLLPCVSHHQSYSHPHRSCWRRRVDLPP